MTKKQFEQFNIIRVEFKKKVMEVNKKYPYVKDEVLKLSEKAYNFPFAFVYNKKLDALSQSDNIKYIWVTDNPGLNEAMEEKYAVGSSGKGAKNFMVGSGLVEDYDKEVIVLNKTFLHTRVTRDLNKLKNFKDIIIENQNYMAKLTIKLVKVFNCPLWILGISNLDKIFFSYASTLMRDLDLDNTYLYYHFSQGQFKKAYNKKIKELPNLNPKEICELIGEENRIRLKKANFLN